MNDPIHIRGVSKSFDNRVAVSNVSLAVKSGEVLVLMGLSGSGKSTLLRMINGLIKPTSGHVEIHGRPLQDLSPQELITMRRQRMAMVFQSFALLPHRTALDNAAFGLEVAGLPRKQRLERARQALERVGLANDLHRKPHQLSGGMRQRVGLARALALDPPILLMDEAFSALDPLIRHDMQNLLLELQDADQRTIVFVSHDLNEAVRIGDRIAVMEDSQLLQCDSAVELLLHPKHTAVKAFFNSVDKTAILNLGAIAEAPVDGIDLEDPDLIVLSASTRLKDAIGTIANATGVVAVINADHSLAGVVSAQTMLRVIERP